MFTLKRVVLASVLAVLPFTSSFADKYQDTANDFKKAGQSSKFFKNSYGYAIFPTIAKGGVGIGGAVGEGAVYKNHKYVGKSGMAQVSVGLQLGAQTYSQVIFLENEKAFNDFTSGTFELGAQASAVAITTGVAATTGTAGTSVSAGTSKKNTAATGSYSNGMAIFTMTKGGLMYEASVAGQKYVYTPKEKLAEMAAEREKENAKGSSEAEIPGADTKAK